MLAANESVAQYLENKRVGAIYRIHEKPDAKRVYEFEMIAATFGYSLGVGALPIQRMQMKTDRRASRGTGRNVRQIEIPKEVHITPRMYQKLTEKIAGKPEEQILSYLMLRSLKQARYSEVNEGHFALAAPTYTHFTSPIRRYPDLIVHRILKEVLRASPEKWDVASARRWSDGRLARRSGASRDVRRRCRHGRTLPSCRSRCEKKKASASSPSDRAIRNLSQRPGPSAATMPPIASRSNRSAAPSLSRSSTTSPKSPASPSAAPTKPNAN